MACCDYQAMDTFPLLNTRFCHIVIYSNNSQPFQYAPFNILICRVLHYEKPSFARQEMAYCILILLLMCVTFLALFVVNLFFCVMYI